MIEVTRLNGKHFVLNADLIETLEDIEDVQNIYHNLEMKLMK